MKRILLLVVGLILYGSFYPWQFHSANLVESPLWILLHSWPQAFARADARDAAINLALYVPFGAFFFLSLNRARRLTLRVALTVGAAACLSAAIEMGQLFDFSRNCSLFDVLCNTLGAGLGIALAAAFPGRIAAAVRVAEEAGAFRASGSIALLYLWAGFQVFPLLPSLSPFVLRGKLAALTAPDASAIKDLLENLGAWLAVAALLNRIAGRRFRLVMTLALLAIPLKLFIAHRTMTVGEVAGALLGAVAGWMFCRNRKRPLLAAGAISLTVLVAAGLLPFRFSSQAQAFVWTPFLPMLSSSWESSFLVLLRKSFLYGSVIWLLNENGRGWVVSTLLVTIPLAMVEAMQVYLPGRTPEITDPILALMTGMALMMLERQSRQNAEP